MLNPIVTNRLFDVCGSTGSAGHCFSARRIAAPDWGGRAAGSTPESPRRTPHRFDRRRPQVRQEGVHGAVHLLLLHDDADGGYEFALEAFGFFVVDAGAEMFVAPDQQVAEIERKRELLLGQHDG
jgi:hypothetical protein